MKPREKPLLTVESDGYVFEILASDGLAIPLHGGFIKLTSKEYAVVEATYAYGRIRRETSKGKLIEVDDVEPVMFIAEYKGWQAG